MKHLVILLVLIFRFCCSAPKHSVIQLNYEPYAQMAIAIMDSLDIRVRPNFRKDPPINFFIAALNKSGETETKPSRSLDSNVVYRKVNITISPEIFKALQRKDTSDLKHYFAVGTIIHEIVHVFQYPDTIATNTGERSDFTNRLEVEAYSVMAYYLLSQTDPKSLSSMVSMFENDKKGLRNELNQFFYSLIRTDLK